MKKDQIIYGTRAVIEAIKSGKEIDKILIKKGIRNTLFYELQHLIQHHQIPVQVVPIEKLNKISSKNHQGIIAYVSNISYQNIEFIIPIIYEKGEIPLILILDRVTDVRNFGAIARTAECTGVHAIIIPFKGAAQINADAIKTSAGALNIVNVCKSYNLKKSIEFLKESGLQIISASEKASKNYIFVDYTKPTAIILGSEEKGISDEYLKISDEFVKIPILGNIHSLNVSSASAVILYEIIRQRNTKP